MQRNSRRSLTTVIVFVLVSFTVAFSQIAGVDDTTSTPIEGAGHNYLKLLTETVSPANGSLNLHIEFRPLKDGALLCRFPWTTTRDPSIICSRPYRASPALRYGLPIRAP